MRSPGSASARRPCRGCRDDEAAVSDVMANLLLLAVTVVFAAGFGALLVNLPPPLENNHAVIESFILPTSPTRLVVEHRGGTHVPLGQLVVHVDLGGTLTRYNVGARLAAGDPAWTVVAADGTVRSATDLFRPGDQVRFTDSALQGPTVRASVVHAGGNFVLQDAAALRDGDTVRPTLVSARTTSTTTVEATLSETVLTVAASDFTVAGATPSTARILGDGRVVELVASAFSTAATPTVATIASPTGTRDAANNLLAASQSVVAADRAAPTISGIIDSASSSQIWVNFTTSESATPTVQYGPTLLYGLTATAPAGTTHSVVLTALTSGTTYHYKIRATDAAGNANTGESSRSKATSGSGGSGGGGTGTNYLEFSGVPSALNPGIVSGTITVTHRNAAGTATNPSSALVVRLATNSTAGTFRNSTTGAIVSSLTIPTSGSTATFQYVDSRPYGPTVITASAANTVPASATVPVTRRGIVPSSGDSVSSLIVNVLYAGEQDRNENGVFIGLNVLNPTPTARTIASVSLTSSPALGTGSNAFFRSAALAAGSDAAFSGCTLSTGDGNTLTCDPTDFTLAAYGMAQVVLTFSTSNFGSDASTFLTGTVTLAGGAGSASSTPLPVRHVGSNGQATMAKVMVLSGSGGDRRAGVVSGVTGGSAADFYFLWTTEVGALTSSTRIWIPAGWSTVQVPSGQASLTSMTVAIKQPTRDEAGWVDVGQAGPSAGSTRELAIRATPPAFTGLDRLRVDFTADPGGTTKPRVVNAYDFGVVVA